MFLTIYSSWTSLLRVMLKLYQLGVFVDNEFCPVQCVVGTNQGGPGYWFVELANKISRHISQESQR